MKTVKAIIERTSDGYWVYFKNLPGCISYGKTIGEIIENSKEVVKEYIEVAKESGDPLPNLIKGEFKFEYKADIKSFFKEFEYVSMSAVAKRSNINASLLRQYASGKKNPSIDQTRKLNVAFN